MRVISCGSPYGIGGIGQHFAQLVEDSRANGQLKAYYSLRVRSGDEEIGHRISMRTFGLVKRYTPIRFRRGWITHSKSELFDRAVSAALQEPAVWFMGFTGKSLKSFERASQLGFKQLELIAVNSHVNNVRRLHARAARDLGISDSWLSEMQRRKTLREYDVADVIYVHSGYTLQSFLDEGFPKEKLKRIHLRPHDRFTPPLRRHEDGVFRIVYVGRVDATKGIPLLLRAFSQLSVPRAELILVGGCPSRRMQRYMLSWMKRDPRILLTPGDPLPALQRADVFVHPSYEDGFGYAPMEALACGVPVIVTEETGMKEHVDEGINGFVVPVGNSDALLERIEHLARYPLPGKTFNNTAA